MPAGHNSHSSPMETSVGMPGVGDEVLAPRRGNLGNVARGEGR